MDVRIPDDYPIGSHCPLRPSRKPLGRVVLMSIPAGLVAVLLPVILGMATSQTEQMEPVVEHAAAEEISVSEPLMPAETIELPMTVPEFASVRDEHTEGM